MADNKTGYLCVYLTNPGQPKPYMARVRRGGNLVGLGSFATTEETALCVARSPEGRAAAERAAGAPPLTSEEAEVVEVLEAEEVEEEAENVPMVEVVAVVVWSPRSSSTRVGARKADLRGEGTREA